MKRLLALFILNTLMLSLAAQHNWAAIPCSKMPDVVSIDKMFVDSLNNEIILQSYWGSKICNTTYKGLFAYNGTNFHDLDRGVNTHNASPVAGGIYMYDCITYNNKTLYGGWFYSIGSNTLYTQSSALWNGAAWDTFPVRCFNDPLNSIMGRGFRGFLKHDSKLWMYGGFDTIGNTATGNLTAFDGYTFAAVPGMTVNAKGPIIQMVAYKNKFIAMGSFNDYPLSSNFCRLAQFDGTSWSSVGNGIQGSLSNVCDIVIYKDTLYIAGAYPKSAGNAGNYIMKWDGTQLSDAGFGNFCGYSPIVKLVPFKNRLYAFGGFICAANQKAFGVAYYENGAWIVPQDSIDNTITGAVVYNDAIYIGGGFKSINGDTSIQKFAKLICPDFDAASGCASGVKESSRELEVKIYPNPSKDKLHLEFEHVIGRISISNTLGQELYQLSKPERKLVVDISQWPAGIYIIHGETSNERGAFKLVKE